jgi:hypothetical protein
MALEEEEGLTLLTLLSLAVCGTFSFPLYFQFQGSHTLLLGFLSPFGTQYYCVVLARMSEQGRAVLESTKSSLPCVPKSGVALVLSYTLGLDHVPIIGLLFSCCMEE